MQGRSGTRFAKKAHVLRLYEEAMASCAVNGIFEPQLLLENNQRLLDARHVVACIEMANVIAFPCVRAPPPHLDRCSDHIVRRRRSYIFHALTPPRRAHRARWHPALARGS